MGNERLEAQTDGGLYIDVPNPVAQTQLHERLVWTRSYYVLPLEVLPVFPIASPFLLSDPTHHYRPNVKSE